MPKDVSFPTAMLAAEMISFSLAATTGLQQRINFLYSKLFGGKPNFLNLPAAA